MKVIEQIAPPLESSSKSLLVVEGATEPALHSHGRIRSLMVGFTWRVEPEHMPVAWLECLSAVGAGCSQSGLN